MKKKKGWSSTFLGCLSGVPRRKGQRKTQVDVTAVCEGVCQGEGRIYFSILSQQNWQEWRKLHGSDEEKRYFLLQ